MRSNAPITGTGDPEARRHEFLPGIELARRRPARDRATCRGRARDAPDNAKAAIQGHHTACVFCHDAEGARAGSIDVLRTDSCEVLCAMAARTSPRSSSRSTCRPPSTPTAPRATARTRPATRRPRSRATTRCADSRAAGHAWLSTRAPVTAAAPALSATPARTSPPSSSHPTCRPLKHHRLAPLATVRTAPGYVKIMIQGHHTGCKPTAAGAAGYTRAHDVWTDR